MKTLNRSVRYRKRQTLLVYEIYFKRHIVKIKEGTLVEFNHTDVNITYENPHARI